MVVVQAIIRLIGLGVSEIPLIFNKNIIKYINIINKINNYDLIQ